MSSAAVGHFTQTTDARGTTHVQGRDARGRSYELVMDRYGHVEAVVDDHVVWFDVSQPA